jgi:hypothetical protein
MIGSIACGTQWDIGGFLGLSLDDIGDGMIPVGLAFSPVVVVERFCFW